MAHTRRSLAALSARSVLLANLRGSNNQRAKCVFQANSRHKLACRRASAVMLANSSASSHRARVQIVSLGRFPSGREGDSNIPPFCLFLSGCLRSLLFIHCMTRWMNLLTMLSLTSVAALRLASSFCGLHGLRSRQILHSVDRTVFAL